MVKVLRKVIEKRVDCPKCGCELSFDNSDEKRYPGCSDSKFIYCVCGYCIKTRDKDGKIKKGVSLITVDVNKEASNG